MGYWYTPATLLILRLNSIFVHRYVANSKAVQGIVRDREHAAPKKISVIYNGYFSESHVAEEDTNVSQALRTLDRGPIIGVVANVRRIKRLDDLISAFGAISCNFPDARLVIVGDVGSEQAKDVYGELKALAAKLAIDDKVIFTGSVHDPRPYIEKFSVAVLCSESEGFSNSIVEYMLEGRPVVCTNVGGNPEIVLDGVNGFVIPVGDVYALAERLAKLLSDRALAQKLGNNAREFVASNFTSARMLREQMACYDEIVA